MKTIIIGFSRPIKPSLFAKAIMWSDKTNYDHAYIRWNWPDAGRDVIFQASSLAVNYESNSTFADHAIPVEEYELQVDDATYSKLMQFCIDNSNKPYGILEILGFVYVKVLKMIGLKVNNPFPSDGSSFVCSQLAATCLQIAGELQIDQNTANIDPLDLNNMIKAKGLKRIL